MLCEQLATYTVGEKTPHPPSLQERALSEEEASGALLQESF